MYCSLSFHKCYPTKQHRLSLLFFPSRSTRNYLRFLFHTDTPLLMSGKQPHSPPDILPSPARWSVMVVCYWDCVFAVFPISLFGLAHVAALPIPHFNFITVFDISFILSVCLAEPLCVMVVNKSIKGCPSQRNIQIHTHTCMHAWIHAQMCVYFVCVCVCMCCECVCVCGLLVLIFVKGDPTQFTPTKFPRGSLDRPGLE